MSVYDDNLMMYMGGGGGYKCLHDDNSGWWLGGGWGGSDVASVFVVRIPCTHKPARSPRPVRPKWPPAQFRVPAQSCLSLKTTDQIHMEAGCHFIGPETLHFASHIPEQTDSTGTSWLPVRVSGYCVIRLSAGVVT